MKLNQLSLRLKLVLFLVLFTACYRNGFSKITMNPYLQAVNGNSIYVMAECDSKDSVTVEYGLTQEYGSKAKTTFYLPTEKKSGLTYVHRIKLENLQPNKLYYYQAYQEPDNVFASGFMSAAQPGTQFTFAIMGDCRSNPGIHSKIAEKIREQDPAFSLYLGDLCHNSDYSSWKQEYFTENELHLISSVPFFNAIGNHEKWSTNTKAFQQSPGNDNTTKDYYSFDYGDVHFLILNTEESCRKGSPQYSFAEQDLKNTKAKWKIVAYHQPAYSAGGDPENKSMQSVCNELFIPNKVDLVLNGHSHFYQHNIVNGLNHFIIAGGGAPLYNPEKKPFVVKSAKEYCFAIVDASDTFFRMRVYNLEWEKIDYIDLSK